MYWIGLKSKFMRPGLDITDKRTLWKVKGSSLTLLKKLKKPRIIIT